MNAPPGEVYWLVIAVNLVCAVTSFRQIQFYRKAKLQAAQLVELYRDLAIEHMPDSDDRWELIRQRAHGYNPFTATAPLPPAKEEQD